MEEAIAAGREFERIYILSDTQSESLKALKAIIKENRLPVHQVPVQKLNRLCRRNHQGVVAFLSIVPNVAYSEIITSAFEKGDTPKLLILDGVTDVRNLGAIARSAVAFGYHGLVISSHGSAMINGDAVKSSAGALLKIAVSKVGDLNKAISEIKSFGLMCFGLTEKTNNELPLGMELQPHALLVGSEETGIDQYRLKLCDALFRIPISAEMDSLNVSVASAIGMYILSGSSSKM